MPKHQASRSRAPRVRVPNGEQVVVSVESKPRVAILCKLSATGGSMRVARSFAPGTLGEITVKTASGKITAAIELLRAGVEGGAPTQAFRFLHMEPGDLRRLQEALEQMRQHGHGEKQGGALRPLLDLTQRSLSIAKKKMTEFSQAFNS